MIDSTLVLLLIKILVIILLAFYSIFSFVLLKKVSFLAQILQTEVSRLLLALVFANFSAALVFFLLALFVL